MTGALSINRVPKINAPHSPQGPELCVEAVNPSSALRSPLIANVPVPVSSTLSGSAGVDYRVREAASPRQERLARENGVVNTAEDKRRAQRAASREQTCGDDGIEVSPLLVFARKATQRSVKFIRWLPFSLRHGHAEDAALYVLRLPYASL